MRNLKFATILVFIGFSNNILSQVNAYLEVVVNQRNVNGVNSTGSTVTTQGGSNITAYGCGPENSMVFKLYNTASTNQTFTIAYTVEYSNHATDNATISVGSINSNGNITLRSGALQNPPPGIPDFIAVGGIVTRITLRAYLSSNSTVTTPTLEIHLDAPLTTTASIGSTSTSLCVGNILNYTSSPSGGVWSSSSTGIATVSSTGVITGVSAGSANIAYTISSGACPSSTATLGTTINAIPTVASITGENQKCIGYATTLGNSTSGGTWSSSATGVATIGSSTGIVTGVGAGTSTISYTVTNGSGCSNAATLSFAVENCDCTPSTCTWGTTGNTNTDYYNYIGTRDSKDLIIKTNGTTRVIVPAGGIVTAPHSMSQLLIDGDGKLYKSNAATYSRSSNVSDYNAIKLEVEKLKQELAFLKQQLSELLKTKILSVELGSTENKLFQNAPNPFNGITKLEYYVTTDNNNFITIANTDGKPIKTINLAGKGKGAIELNASNLKSGTYTYSLYVNGILADTKLMMNR